MKQVSHPSDSLASKIIMKPFNFQDKTLLNGVMKTFDQVSADWKIDINTLATLCDPFSLLHEGYFYNR